MFSTTMPYTEISSIRLCLTSFAVQVVERRLEHQSLTWHYLTKITARKPRVRNGAVLVRKRRPVDTVSGLLFIADPPKQHHAASSQVCKHVLALLNFSRNQRAWRLPLAKGLLYFAFSAPVNSLHTSAESATCHHIVRSIIPCEVLQNKMPLLRRLTGTIQTSGGSYD
jgi:hypothetical protein